MRPPLPKQIQNLLLVLSLWVLAGLACQPGGTTPPPPAPTPTPRFNFAVLVRDRDKNEPVGQATVTLAVGNETLDQIVADDNGQANFSVDPAYSGRRARLFAKSPSYHPADLEMSLTPERKIIQLISRKYPKIDPDPVEPPPPADDRPRTTSTPALTPTPSLEVFSLGESKTGVIADNQVIDYRFEANENAPLLFTARGNDERSVSFRLEIYDSRGFPQKYMQVSGRSADELDFTPPRTGSYILRLRGTNKFGAYLVNMQEIR